MRNYSIFEIGMHWVILIFIFLRGIISYIRMTTIWELNQTTIDWGYSLWGLVVYILSYNFIYLIVSFIYLLIFLLKKKVKKNISMIIVLLLLINLSVDFVAYANFVLELKTLVSLAMVILFLVSFNTNEKIILEKERNDSILDDLDMN